ncbi:hypothetical protein [Streptomyces sp. NPDC055287]
MSNTSDSRHSAPGGPGWLAAPTGYVITPQEFHAEIRSLREGQASLAAKLDVTRDISERVQDHENRLRALESRRWPLPVVVALCAVLAAVAAFLALQK